MAWSGMSSPDCGMALCLGYRDAKTRKACVMALRNAEKELLLLCGAEVGEMNVGGM
ncbi:hypothetical protein [Sediminibacterium sp. C3]|uniref:hypothetical protein n=1 Tax=Sediminibacterium sp. C3 TaxID=1267211 RepID=UPI001377D0C0|nr:hypothetical protein [Sediminibacterium sp. C3]